MKLSVWSEYLTDMQSEKKLKIFAEYDYKYNGISNYQIPDNQ